MEEVFDQATRLALRELMSKGELSELNGVVSAGKEARVYYGVTGKGVPGLFTSVAGTSTHLSGLKGFN